MKRDRPSGDHSRVLLLKDLREGQSFALLCCFISLLALGWRALASPGVLVSRIVWIAAITSAGFAVCYYLLDCFFEFLRSRLRRHAVPPSEAVVWRPPVRPGINSTLEPPEINFCRPVVASDDSGAPYRPVSVYSNVVGRPPLNIAYFRCFANVERTRTFLEGAWNEFGHVHFLRDPKSMIWRELWRSRTPEKMAELVVRTADQLWDRLCRASKKPEWNSIHPYGEYPVHEFICGDAFWQQAADKLITKADLVVIDLSGHSSKSRGLQFELERAFATKRLDQVVVLADEHSDRKYLANEVRRAWTGTSVTGGPTTVHAYIVDRVVTEWESVSVSEAAPPVVVRTDRLRSDRGESRNLLRSILENRHS